MIFHSIVIQAVSMFYHVFLRFLIVKSFIFNLPSAPAERHYFISISFCYFYVCNKNKRSYNFAFYCYLSFNNINCPFIVPILLSHLQFLFLSPSISLRILNSFATLFMLPSLNLIRNSHL